MASRRVVVPTHLWHVQLHQKVAHERLCFAWITYTDRYDGRTSLLQIRAALQDIDVRSYAVWELLGERDVLIKAYLPTDSSGEDLRAALAKNVRGANSEIFGVDKIVVHWMWKREIDIPDFYSSVDSDHMSQLNAKAYVPLSALRMYQRKNFIFPVENRAGIKFFARIPDPLQGTSGDAILEDDLLEIISKAEKSQGLGGLVLYKGSGARTKYLVTGWVAPEHWTKLLSHLNSRINEHGRLVGYGKTVTSLSAGIGPVERGEQLIGPGQRAGVAGFEPMPATELLNFDESQILEFKGSAFTDIDKWLETRRKERPDFVIGEVASGVVGLLNNKGGRLVIGVLEQKRYTAPNRRAWIENEFPDRSETDLHIAIGVDHEVSEINGKKDFDLYLRRLQDKLKSSIIPNPEPYITITSEPVGPFGKFRVVVIEVRIPGHEFWVKEGRQIEYYARQGGSTKKLVGPEMMSYIRELAKSRQE